MGIPVAAHAAAAAPLMVVPGSADVTRSGAFTYTVPIEVPPGTAGMAPKLALVYSSENGDGFEGWGWTLAGLPAITRCPRTIADDQVHGGVNYDSGPNGVGTNDRFCVDGQKLVVTTGAYGADGSTYQTRYQGFSKITAHVTTNSGNGPAWFELHAKNGTVYEFGNTTDSAVQVVGKSTVRKWLVDKVTDTSGNYLTVSYATVLGDALPVEIDYTGNANASPAVTPYNSVTFSYATRGDPSIKYKAGSYWKLTKVLTEIKTYNGTPSTGTVVLDYKLGYEHATTDTSQSHARLKAITLYDTNGKSLNGTTFGWQGGGMSGIPASPTGNSLAHGYSLFAGDFDGDGLTDAFVLNPNCPAGGDVYSGPSFGSAHMTATYDYWDPKDTQYHQAKRYAGGDACLLEWTDSLPSLVDLNADGRADFMINSNYWYDDPNDGWGARSFSDFLLNNAGTTFSQPTENFNMPAGLMWGDFNGDGRADGFSATLGWVYGGNGDGTFTTDTSHPSIAGTLSAGDFDGDGCTDILSQGSSNKITYFCQPAVSQANVSNFSGGTIIPGDFNGDGLTDLLVIAAGIPKLYLSTGTGLTDPYTVTIGPPNGPSNWSGYTVVTGDWNGDGMTDVALISQTSGTPHQIFQSTGADFANVGSVTNNVSGSTAVVADWNNDGADDIWLKSTSGDSEILFTFKPELMTSITNGVGGVTTIKYSPLNINGSFYTKGTGATYSAKDLDGAYYLTSEVDADDGMKGTHAVTYTYNGAKADVTAPPPHGIARWSLPSAGFLGFTTTYASDQQTGLITATTFRTDIPFLGFVSAQTVKKGTTRVLYSAANTPKQGSGDPSYVYLYQSIVSRNDLDGTALPTVTTTYTPDSYGNMYIILQTVDDGSSVSVTNTFTNDANAWVLGQITGTTITKYVSPGPSITRTFSYTPDPKDTGITQTAVTQPGDNTCNAGSSSCTLTQTYGIDAFGNYTSVSITGHDIQTENPLVQYDSNGEFPTKITDALSHVTQVSYDQRFGGLTSSTDPNGVTSSEFYDSFGRPQKITKPDTNLITFSYLSQADKLPTGETWPKYGVYAALATPQNAGGTAQNGAASIIYYDVLGRVVATDMQGQGGAWIRQDTLYDSAGNASGTTRPYFLSGGVQIWTTSEYDALGRPTQTIYPDTSTDTYCYKGLINSIDKSAGGVDEITTFARNAQGLIANVQENGTGACADANPQSTYTYDAFGDPLQVTVLGNTITNTFDVRGRKATSSDPDMGNWSYAYDQLDELTSQTDAKHQTTSITYDKLRRPNGRTEPDLATTWSYDDANHNGIGKLSYACTPCTNYKRQYFYDTFGRISETGLAFDNGTSHHYFPSYNSDGRLDTMTYPSGFVAKYVYDAYGYLSQILDNSNSTVIWTANQRDAELRLNQSTAVNGVVTNQAFDFGTDGQSGTDQLVSICASSKAPPCQGEIENQSYGWDSFGNLLGRGDTYQDWNETMCYDAWNRLTKYSLDGSSCTAGTDRKTIAYSSGNMSRKSDICGTTDCMNYGANGAGPHQLTSITGTGISYNGVADPTFQYDANGNMLCMLGAGQTCDAAHAARYMSWTSFNMVASITQGASALYFSYGAEHQRYKMCNATCGGSLNSTTLYFSDPATGGYSEKFSSGITPVTWRDYIVADGQIVAVRILNGTTARWRYVVGDHLGSVTSITDASGSKAAEERDSYDAWGKRRNPDATDDSGCTILSQLPRGFTEHEMLDKFCLINMNGRIYDPGLGLFLSPDTIVPDPYSFSGYLRYTYLNNNPLNGTDPTGHAGQECKNTVDPCHPDQPAPEVVIVWGDDWGGPPDFGQYGGANSGLGGGIRFVCGGSGCGGFGLSGGGLASFGGNEGGAGGNGAGQNSANSPPGICKGLFNVGSWMKDAAAMGTDLGLSMEVVGLTVAVIGAPAAPETAGLSELPGGQTALAGGAIVLGSSGLDVLGDVAQGFATGNWQNAKASGLGFAVGLGTVGLSWAMGPGFEKTGGVLLGAVLDIAAGPISPTSNSRCP